MPADNKPLKPMDRTTDDSRNDPTPEGNEESHASSTSASEEALPLDRDVVREFLKRIPKVELHAHLNGCVREATLLELARERGVDLCPRLFPTCASAASETASSASPPDSWGSLHRSSDDPPVRTFDNTATSSHSSPAFYHRKPRSLADCFQVFGEIARVVDDLEALRRVTTEALHDFAAEGTAYLELRSTPKRLRRRPRLRNDGGGGGGGGTGTSNSEYDDSSNRDDLASKREYVETVLEAIGEFERNQMIPTTPEEQSVGSSRPRPERLRYPMHCRLLVAIDRSRSLEEAQEHVDLAVSFLATRVVVGIDVGGNPSRGDLRTFFPLLRRAKDAGLLVTLHCAEVNCGGDDDSDDFADATTLSPAELVARKEAEAILEMGQFVPDRIGHALLLPPKLQRRLLELRIPVETCPTSNVMTLELAQLIQSHSDAAPHTHHHHFASVVDGLKRHPQLRSWLERDHPLAICTDDPGVFGTTLTREWELLVAAHASCLVRGPTKQREEEEEEEEEEEAKEDALHRFHDQLRRRVVCMMARSMDCAFCDDRLKDEVRKLILGSLDDLDGR
jgi:adenosine deaminase